MKASNVKSEVFGALFGALFVAASGLANPPIAVLALVLTLLFPWVGVGIFCLYALFLALCLYLSTKADGTGGQAVFVGILLGCAGAVVSLIITGISFLVA